jgi:predicted alpha/beta superfamily hydrolase
VLYLNDGQNVFAWRSRKPKWRIEETAARLVASGAIVPLAIVGIDHRGGLGRGREYLPFPDPRNRRARSFEADRYVDFVIRTVLPALPRWHGELRNVEHVGFGGSSYGAIAALWAAIRHPGVFDRLLLESPPLWVGDGRLIDAARHARSWPERIAIGVGTAEARSDDASARLVALVRELARVLRGRAGRDRIRLIVAKNARHHELDWARRSKDAVAWLFRDRERA